MKKALMFSGQGSQYVGMCLDLYQQYDEVKEVFDMAEEVTGYPIRRIIFEDEALLNDTTYTQVAMLTIYQSLLKVLEHHQIECPISFGLSLGEYGAYLHQGVFDFDTGLKLVKYRGEVMMKACSKSPGVMSAILGIDGDMLAALIDGIPGYVTIANYNTYGQLVISGDEAAVEALEKRALENGAKRAIRLNTSGAFHSEKMHLAKDLFQTYLETIHLNEPRHRLLVNVTGDDYRGQIKQVMTEHLTSSVKFYQTIERLIQDGVDTFIELGPKRTLSGFVKKIDKTVTILNVEDIDSLRQTMARLEESR